MGERGIGVYRDTKINVYVGLLVLQLDRKTSPNLHVNQELANVDPHVPCMNQSFQPMISNHLFGRYNMEAFRFRNQECSTRHQLCALEKPHLCDTSPKRMKLFCVIIPGMAIPCRRMMIRRDDDGVVI